MRLVSVRDNAPIESEQLVFAARESIGLSVVPLLALAQRHITEAELDALDALCAKQPARLSRAQTIRFRLDYWTRVAVAAHGGGRAPAMRWWIRTTCELEERLDPSQSSSKIVACYRELSRVLRRRNGAVEYWLTQLEPVFGATEARLRSR